MHVRRLSLLLLHSEMTPEFMGELLQFLMNKMNNL